MKIFNNLTRQKEAFKTIMPDVVRFYSCGPTTYDFLHIGNARALVVGDLFHRVLMAYGFKVNFVRNYTDVDDKIIDRANELKVNALDHAERFVKECQMDMDFLRMLPATSTPKVSETIPEIIAMIERLIARGFAYEVEGEVLYHVPKFSDYGKLSKIKLDSLKAGVRVAVEGNKKHSSDFVLWKPAKPQEPFWASPWGNGRPGWHIECSAMAYKFLGESIDLHHGGVDLQFPHHENEIAQSEGANGCEFCHQWAHNEFLNFGSEKMSKSLGNVITIRKFCETYSGEILRHILLSIHYRSKIEWNENVILKAINEVTRLHEFKANLDKKKLEECIASDEMHKISLEILAELEKLKQELFDDFNVPSALGIFFGMVKEFNRLMTMPFSLELLNAFLSATDFITQATGLIHADAEDVLKRVQNARKHVSGSGDTSEDEVLALINERGLARKEKNWARSDEIRNRLNELGVVLKDNPDGTVTWSYK